MARTDALLLPESGEEPGYDTTQNRRFQHIAQFHRFGIPWRPSVLNPGRDAKQAERDLTALVNAGDLDTPAARRREFVRLTRHAHARARILIGWEASIDQAAAILEQMHKARKQAVAWNGSHWLPLSPKSRHGRAALLFALCHGWITAELDYHANPVFSITEQGHAALKSGMVEDVDAKPVKALRAIYEETYKAACEDIPLLPLLNPHDMHLTGISTLRNARRSSGGGTDED